jgi:hypothetical protein
MSYKRSFLAKFRDWEKVPGYPVPHRMTGNRAVTRFNYPSCDFRYKLFILNLISFDFFFKSSHSVLSKTSKPSAVVLEKKKLLKKPVHKVILTNETTVLPSIIGKADKR